MDFGKMAMPAGPIVTARVVEYIRGDLRTRRRVWPHVDTITCARPGPQTETATISVS